MNPSPFTSRLNSNYVPTDSESLEIQTLLKLPTSRLEELSTQLHELDDQSTQLRNEHSSLLLFISKHRALISLIRKLPINILQEIFIACLPAAHNAVMSRWEPPILLTQICSSWRKVALATPRLWKSIHIAVPGNRSGSSREHPSAAPRRVELIHRRSEAVLEWLSRSATCPLDISLGQLDRFGDSTLDGFDKIIDYLIRFSERWRNIRFSAPSIALLPVAALPPSKVPLLETLFLNCLICTGGQQQHDYRRDPRSIWMTSGVLKAPKLRELWLHSMWLSLQRLRNPEDLTRLPINWSQLTNISLIEGMFSGAGQFSLTVPRAYKLLSLCPNLITCRLEIGMTITYEEEPPLETTAALISLPFLTSLLVVENSSLSGLFTLLRLPSLSCIEFRTTIRFTYQATTSLLSLLTHSHNTIQLIADTRFFMRKDFIKCLRLCPLLKSLSIRKSTTIYPHSIPITLHSLFRIDDAFLKLFIESSNDDDDEGYLCPHLEDFEISIDTAFSETTLLQFVKKKNGDSNNSNSSNTGLARLKRLSVVFYCRPQSDISINQELEPYEQATGLVATITYPPTAFFSAFGGLPGYLPSY